MHVRPVIAGLGLLALSLSLTGCQSCPWFSNSSSAKPKPTPSMIGSNMRTGATPAGDSPKSWNSQPARTAAGNNMNDDANSTPPAGNSYSAPSANAANPYTANPGRAIRTAPNDTPQAAIYSTNYPDTMDPAAAASTYTSVTAATPSGPSGPAANANVAADNGIYAATETPAPTPPARPVIAASYSTPTVTAPAPAPVSSGTVVYPNGSPAQRTLNPSNVQDTSMPRGSTPTPMTSSRSESQIHDVQGTRPMTSPSAMSPLSTPSESSQPVSDGPILNDNR